MPNMQESNELEELMELIDESGLPKTFIARKLGISRTALYSKLSGLTEFTFSESEILSDLLGIATTKDKRRVFLPKCSKKLEQIC